ncbi:hypothetical protein N8T08_003127 [Aspergillus melleus]|uniref:Uncharacterized protein n=1 Tax=Aspergillus melleus TaxID=138277 RepID=A0ACC3B742_9EURO|nr:hypothetical protein N8T08_003127 [Aspergillus melleus]
MDITGNALIVGAGSGIGRDVSIAYALEGARALVLADINRTATDETARLCREAVTQRSGDGLVIHVLEVDVSNEESVETMVRQAVANVGRIDYCVDSAGLGVRSPLEIAEASGEELDRFWSVNVKGTFNCLKAVSAAMKRQDVMTVPSRTGPREVGRGAIIALGSCNSYVATPRIVQYTTAKHAVLGMVKNAALDNAPYKIRVNAVCPSWVDTPMTDEAIEGDPNLKHIIRRVVPLGRIAHPEEVSDAIMFLSSPRSSYMTGGGLLVDGGATLQLQI